jgi:hypothetical protein
MKRHESFYKKTRVFLGVFAKALSIGFVEMRFFCFQKIESEPVFAKENSQKNRLSFNRFLIF